MSKITNDLIDRQSAIDALTELIHNYKNVNGDMGSAVNGAKEAIKNIPSTEQKIIHCKDCRWWDNENSDIIGYCHAMKHCHYSKRWEIVIYRKCKGDFYCGDAEQRIQIRESN